MALFGFPRHKVTVKRFIVICLWLGFLQSSNTVAQQALYQHLNWGSYSVGYADTLLFDAQLNYTFKDYKGPQPVFAQVWFPRASESSKDTMHFSDYLYSNHQGPIKYVHEALMMFYRTFTLKEIIPHELSETKDSLTLAQLKEELWSKVLSTPLRSVKSAMPSKLPFPVLLYHHGAQGSFYENYVLAEYFASKGYVVVSANFHLPYEGHNYGGKPFEQIQQQENNLAAYYLLNFSDRLSSHKQKFYAGHSWGAQVGWTSLKNRQDVTGFISLETTVEFQPDTNRIKKYWPELYEVVTDYDKPYSCPILMMAATGNEKPFTFFEPVKVPTLLQIPVEKTFDHSAYISVYHYKTQMRDQLSSEESIHLDKSIKLYAKQLMYIEDFMQNASSGTLPKGLKVEFMGF